MCACRWRDSLPLSGWSDLLDAIATSLTLDVVWEGLLLNLAISGIEVRLESDGILIRYAAVCAIENKGNLAIRELDVVLGCAVYCLAYPSASMLLDKKLTEGRSVSLHKCFEAPVIERGKLKSTSIDVLKEFSARVATATVMPCIGVRWRLTPALSRLARTVGARGRRNCPSARAARRNWGQPGGSNALLDTARTLALKSLKMRTSRFSSAGLLASAARPAKLRGRVDIAFRHLIPPFLLPRCPELRRTARSAVKGHIFVVTPLDKPWHAVAVVGGESCNIHAHTAWCTRPDAPVRLALFAATDHRRVAVPNDNNEPRDYDASKPA